MATHHRMREEADWYATVYELFSEKNNFENVKIRMMYYFIIIP